MPGLHPIPLPKPIHVSAPKIAQVHVAKVGGGMKVSHMMDGGAPTEHFAFQDPKAMMKHLARIQSTEWANPDRNEAGAVTRNMDIGAPA